MGPESLTRVLVHVQAHLDEDLTLERLASCAHLSPFHFQREFRRAVGENPREYVERLRVERAAFRLRTHEDTILDVALQCGYQSPDTFARAFRRRFGMTPRAWRGQRQWPLAADPTRKSRQREGSPEYALSKSRVVRTRSLTLAFVRHVGRYEEVPADAWEVLHGWARSQGCTGSYTLFGIGHDAPELTDSARLRFDAAIEIDARVEGTGPIGCQTLEGRYWVVTTHSGGLDSLSAAYPEIVSRAAALAPGRVVGLPCVEIYRTQQVRPDLALAHTDVYVPIEARA